MGVTAGDPIVIFGAGAGGRRAATHLSRARDVRYFVDSDEKKHGTRVLGWEVRAPRALLETPQTSVIIASIHSDQILDQLMTLGVPAHRIEIVNPDQFVDGGRDPFPTGIALILLAFLAMSVTASWWMLS